MGRSDAGADRLHDFEGAHRPHRSFGGHHFLQRLALHELHHEKRHRGAHDSKVRDRNDVLMANRGGGQSFLPKTRDEIWIVADQIGKNDLDCVLGLEKDVPAFVNNAHAALAQPPLKVVAAVKDRFAGDGGTRRGAVVRTKSHVVGKTDATLWTLFHQ